MTGEDIEAIRCWRQVTGNDILSILDAAGDGVNALIAPMLSIEP